MTIRARRDDRILVRDGRRHHRRTYSRTEFRLGLAALGALAAILAWVVWRGAHPDPALLGSSADLLATGPPTPAERGPLPAELARPGWSEASLSTFDADNLYEKINGREGYYKSFGFQRLHFVSLRSDRDPATAVDVEVYHLGEAANALGAYAGERSPDARAEIGEDGMSHFDRNAFYMTRGSYYVRAIGTSEGSEVRAQLEHLKAAFEAELEGEELPFGFALFAGQLGHAPSRISYFPENALSFGFAENVYAVLLEDDETELFIMPANGTSSADQLATQFQNGFLGYGTPAGETEEVDWVKDRYLGTFAGAVAVGSWVVGVRSAPSAESAAIALRSLREAVATLPGGIDE